MERTALVYWDILGYVLSYLLTQSSALVVPSRYKMMLFRVC